MANDGWRIGRPSQLVVPAPTATPTTRDRLALSWSLVEQLQCRVNAGDKGDDRLARKGTEIALTNPPLLRAAP